MKTRTFRTAITALYNGRYVPPGTEITLPENEAKEMIARFGEFEEGESLSLEELASVEGLNKMHAIYNG